MPVSPRQALATAQYWDERYKEADGTTPTHEWLRSYRALKPFLQKYLFQQYPPAANPTILHLGSGDSTVPYDLVAEGYLNQVCLDFSSVLVDVMARRRVEGVTWQLADVRNMSDTASSSCDVALDKSTMDTMIHGSPWDPPAEVKKNTGEYLSEVHRVLKPDGIFLYITFRQVHFVKPLLSRGNMWDVEVEQLNEAGSFDYNGFILKKRA